MKRTITQNATAFITRHCSVDIRDVASGEFDATNLTFSQGLTDMSAYGWVSIGKAVITIEIDADVDALVSKKIDTIKDQIQQIYAAAEGKVQELQEEISKLQSIGYSQPSTDVIDV